MGRAQRFPTPQWLPDILHAGYRVAQLNLRVDLHAIGITASTAIPNTPYPLDRANWL
ncbi:hypothetical protein [Pontibacterium sp.]|uniref:hypothetical protein n=1 Tax=Pontibacterium sp. TaxID=2036026 RepID=UPI00356704A0